MSVPSQRGEVSVDRAGDGTSVVHLTGEWTLEGGIPPVDSIAGEIEQARRITFDAAKLANWDTALVAFVAAIADRVREKKIEVDRSGLPEGLQRLLRLAEAVPEQQGVRRSDQQTPLVDRIGEQTVETVAASLDTLAFLGEATLSLGRFAVGRARVRMQDLLLFLQECGPQALPIVSLISVLVGMILAFVGAVQLEKFGAEIYVADLVAIAMVREMGCVMTGIIMAGRTGSGFAAQLGTMKVTQEIDAYVTLGIQPIDFLVLPRILALVLMMPLLTIYSDLLGIVGGGIVSVGMLDLTPFQYVTEGKKVLTFTNCMIGVGKSVVFGALIAIAGCLRGMQCGKSSSAVGDAATSAVVTAIVLLVVADGIFAVLFNILHI